jgi:hypothetical protein
MIDKAIADAILKLSTIPMPSGGTDIKYQYDSMGMPQVIIAPDIPTQMPSAIIVEQPQLPPSQFTPRPGGSPFPNITINAGSFYGGYLAAQGFTASQSRIATNNGGISTFVSQ